MFNNIQRLSRIDHNISLRVLLYAFVVSGTHAFEKIGLLLLKAIQRDIGSP